MGSFTESTTTTNNMEKFLCERLLDPTQSISERFRALFSLQNLKGSGPRNVLIHATRDSASLLAHEAAFALGQMQDAEAIPALQDVLNDLSLHPIIRHEAAEALGAIGLESNIPLLKDRLEFDPAQEVRETCELALSRIEDVMVADNDNGSFVTEKSPFMSVDPAAPTTCTSVDKLREVLLDEGKGMYDRYAALFTLRNNGSNEAVSAIIESLGSKSALLKHEVLKELDCPILYSLSPGTSVTPAMAKYINRLTNMYRITGDDWDTWADVVSHFNVSRDFATANMIGTTGLQGKLWPDLDVTIGMAY